MAICLNLLLIMLTFSLLIMYIYTHLVQIVLSIKKVGEKMYELDLRGYVCPYPQMYTSQALTKLPRGSILKVVIDNPPSIENIKSVAQKVGAKSVSVNSQGGEWDITI
jgi:tRNA 2-thiouridine synthesizing protein A